MKNMFKVVLAICLLGAAQAYAATPGVYVGAGLGYSKTDDLNGFQSPKGEVTGKGVVGYNFNKNFGLEAGYMRTADTTYTIKDVPAKAKFKLSAETLAVKGYVPVASNVDLYALGGIAVVNSKTQVSIDRMKFKESTRTEPSYLVGAGVNYQINQNLSTNLEYSRIQGHDEANNKAPIPAQNLVTVGLAYSFD